MTPADGSKANTLAVEGAPRIIALAGIVGRQPVLAHILGSSGVAIEEVADASAVLSRLREAPDPDLIVLEWGLSDTATIEALQGIFVALREPSVLLLVASPAVERQDAGASLPRHRPSEERGGTCVLSLEPSRAYWNGRRVPLSLTEFRIVSRLATSPGVDFSHRDIYDLMKGEGVVSGRGEGGYRGNVRAAVKRIRRKFVRIDPGFKAIRNYHGFGYHWDEGVVADTREPTSDGNFPTGE